MVLILSCAIIKFVNFIVSAFPRLRFHHSLIYLLKQHAENNLSVDVKRSYQLQFKKIIPGQCHAVKFNKFDKDRNAVVTASFVTR